MSIKVEWIFFFVGGNNDGLPVFTSVVVDGDGGMEIKEDKKCAHKIIKKRASSGRSWHII